MLNRGQQLAVTSRLGMRLSAGLWNRFTISRGPTTQCKYRVEVITCDRTYGLTLLLVVIRKLSIKKAPSMSSARTSVL